MSIINKDFLTGFVIACIISLFFYYTNLGCASTKVDVYLIEFGMVLPFFLPLFFLRRILKDKRKTRKVM